MFLQSCFGQIFAMDSGQQTSVDILSTELPRMSRRKWSAALKENSLATCMRNRSREVWSDNEFIRSTKCVVRAVEGRVISDV